MNSVRVFCAAALARPWLAEGMRPDRWDLSGAAICLVGAATMLFGPRQVIGKEPTKGGSP